MRHKGAFEEKAVGLLMGIGLLVCVLSLIFMWVFSVAGVYRGTYTREPITNRITDAYTLNLVPLCIFFLVVGILMIGGGIGYGLYKNSTENKGERQVEPYLRVLARFAYDGSQLLTSEYEFEAANKPRFYVKALTQHGVVVDLETSLDVYYQAGEGMVGEGEIQGRWLGRFVPYIGEPPAV